MPRPLIAGRLRPIATTATPLASRVADFVALTKPRIIELLLVTTVPTMVVAAGELPPLGLTTATVIGGALAAGGANAINMYLDRDIDRLMERTRDRPLVTGKVAPGQALAFAVTIEVAAFALLWMLVNPLSAVLAVAACLFYVFVYTVWLKRRSPANIVIGGAAGAVPVLIGWAAATGELSWDALVLFAIVFFWTPPHFWALAIKYRDDYASAAIPMRPVVEGQQRTAWRILVYTVVVGVLVVAFGVVATMSWLYWGTAVLLSAAFIGYAVGLVREMDQVRSAQRSVRLFRFSITHLTVLFVVMAVDRLVNGGPG